MHDNKTLYGQFFTITNPFGVNAFFKWIEKIPYDTLEVLEPFAGSNNIVNLVNEVCFFKDINWTCYDIDNSFTNMAPQYEIHQRDTIKYYPKGFDVAITNPPYLGKSSASRKKLPYPDTQYDDVYKYALSIMLEHTKYIAAIIPESFITSNLFIDRIDSIVSLNCKMFDDTDFPVCLALFIPTEEKDNPYDYSIYNLDHYIGRYLDIKEKKEKLFEYDEKLPWKFNDPDGNIGICCIDNNQEPSIEFISGDRIKPEKIKISSRAYTRISGPIINNTKIFLEKCNEILSVYREITSDIFLTSFKTLRKDGKYRRRLDFKTAREIMNTSYHELKNKDK